MKVLQGVVTSAKNANTVTVEVTRKWQHPLYKKYVKRTKKYACHVVEMKLQTGDVVDIQECRPISKTKHFQVIAKVDKKVTKKIVEEAAPVKQKKEKEEVKEEKKVVKAVVEKPKAEKTEKKTKVKKEKVA